MRQYKKSVKRLGKDYTAYIKEFDNLSEVANFTKDSKDVVSWFRGQAQAYDINSDMTEWCKTKSMNEAVDLLTHGWADGAKDLMKSLDNKISKAPETRTRQKSVYDVVGGNCSVPRYLQGVPTNMVRQIPVKVKQKVVTINKDICFSNDVRPEDIINSSADCLKEVYSLEQSGVRVNLNIFFVTYQSGSKGNRILAYKIPVKKSSERMSVAKMAFCLAHPSMLRRFGLGIVAHDENSTYDFVPGCGYPVNDKNTLSQIWEHDEFFLHK